MPDLRPVLPSDHLFSELVVRLIAIDKSGDLHSFGTAFIFQPYLALTAKHVIEEFLKLDPSVYKGEGVSFNFWAIQIAWEGLEHNYVVWEVSFISLSGHSDLAILKLHPYDENAAKYTVWKTVPCTLILPKVGDSIIGFGVHNITFAGSKVNSAGKVEHIELNDQASSSRGVVRAVYPLYRDVCMLSFPCFEVDAQFEGGMSGGLVINERSQVCGIVCSSMPATQEHPIPSSYVAMLWPMMAMKIDFSLFRTAPVSGEQYVLELARHGVFTPEGWEQIVIEENPIGPGCKVSMQGPTHYSTGPTQSRAGR
jgi:Trypsin-like peptidase domain